MKSDFRNWSDIRVFLAVLRKGSTLAASRDLGMAQPTVARRIEALEHALELTLFSRDTRGFRPTAAAIRVAERAAEVEAAAEAFWKAAETARREGARPIRLTAPRVNFSENLSAILADFTAAHPGTQFELVSSYQYLDLIAGEADVAVRIARQIDDERLICRRMTTVTSSLYASRGYAEKHGVPGSDAEFAGHRFVAYEGRYASLRMNQWLLARIDPSQIVSRCTDVEGMVAAVGAGLGIGPVATSLARDHGGLVRCFEPPEGTAVASWLVISPDAWRRPEVKAFAAFFVPRYRAIFRANGPS